MEVQKKVKLSYSGEEKEVVLPNSYKDLIFSFKNSYSMKEDQINRLSFFYYDNKDNIVLIKEEEDYKIFINYNKQQEKIILISDNKEIEKNNLNPHFLKNEQKNTDLAILSNMENNLNNPFFKDIFEKYQKAWKEISLKNEKLEILENLEKLEKLEEENKRIKEENKILVESLIQKDRKVNKHLIQNDKYNEVNKNEKLENQEENLYESNEQGNKNKEKQNIEKEIKDLDKLYNNNKIELEKYIKEKSELLVKLLTLFKNDKQIKENKKKLNEKEGMKINDNINEIQKELSDMSFHSIIQKLEKKKEELINIK